MSDTRWSRKAGHITVTVDTDGYTVINHQHGAVAVLNVADLINALVESVDVQVPVTKAKARRNHPARTASTAGLPPVADPVHDPDVHVTAAATQAREHINTGADHPFTPQADPTNPGGYRCGHIGSGGYCWGQRADHDKTNPPNGHEWRQAHLLLAASREATSPAGDVPQMRS